MPLVTVYDRYDRTTFSGPVTCGCPWPQGAVHDTKNLVLLDPHGLPQQLQARALSRWPDDSVKWLLLDWYAHDIERATATYHVLVGKQDCPIAPTVKSVCTDHGLTINTEKFEFDLRRGFAFPWFQVSNCSGSLEGMRSPYLSAVDDNGKESYGRVDSFEIVEPGPLRLTVKVDGSISNPEPSDVHPLRFTAFLHFLSGSGQLPIDLTFHNPNRASHPRNFWELGQGGSLYYRDISLVFPLPAAKAKSEVYASVEASSPWRSSTTSLEIYQDSSGGPNWDGSNHVNRFGKVPLKFRGYRFREADCESFGVRASPVISCALNDLAFTMGMGEFWQNFPKALEVDQHEVRLRLFPTQFMDLHEIQGGEQKTHSLVIEFSDSIPEDPASYRSRLLARCDPGWYSSTKAVSRLTPRSSELSQDYLTLVDSAIDGDDSFFNKREVVDEFGWRHFGELYADHEAIYHKGPEPLVSHYNNQYDVIGGCALQFLRSGDWRWWNLMSSMSRHVADIDIYHTDDDKSAYNHGLFWHTYHYVDAGKSTHRAYARGHAPAGGGPSGGHCYSSGLLLHHLLSGDPLSRSAVLELANWVISMDDGSKTCFRWLSSAPTGHATASGSPLYHGPGRAPANSILTLLNAFELTHESRYLKYAEGMIQRSIHPEDDISERDLLDAELKWFYTMFLQALARYLEVKFEWTQFDAMYEYARSALLHYSRWMCEHEYPYLERPERLEYPTETWSAQDLRKAEVFFAAARFACTEERFKFVERGEFFFRSAIDSLNQMPTRTLARPIVLLLSNGLARAHYYEYGELVDLVDFNSYTTLEKPKPFIPQKDLALRRLKLIVAGLSAFGLLTLVSGVWVCLHLYGIFY